MEKISNFYKKIIDNDGLLFDLGFNTYDISQFETLLSDNLKVCNGKEIIDIETK